MGFWNALSVLAPVAPAMSDAQDIRTQRTQDAAKFASDEQLKQAQLTAQKLAAQGEQQRITQRNQPITYGEPTWNDTTHSYQITTVDPNTGAFSLKDVPGVDPSAAAAAKYAAFQKEHKQVTGKDFTPEEDASAFFQTYGYKPPVNAKLTPLTGAAGQPRLGADGKTYVRDMFDSSTQQTVETPMPPDYKPPAPKPGTPHPGMANGRNVFGFFNPGKQQWQDAAGNALPDFRPQPSFAETGMYDPMVTYNPQTQSMALGSFNKRTGGLSFANGSGASIPLPPAIAATIGKEFGTAREAQTRLKIMQQNAQEALATGNQQAMVSLLMNHIGMTLGAQKGTRVAKSVIDEARQSAPWIDTKLASFGHQDANGDFVFDGAKGGINLTGEQIGQMVGLAKQRNDLQWQQVKDTGETYGVDLSGAVTQTQGAAALGAGGKNTGGGGNTGQFVVIDPNNKPHRFDTQAQADAFRALLKPAAPK